MARLLAVFIRISILIMDITAGILGIEAQIAQSKGKHSRAFVFKCKGPIQKAYKLGLAAAVLLAFAHALANLLGGYVCIRSQEESDQSSSSYFLGGCLCCHTKEEFHRPSTNRQFAVTVLVLSWIIAVVGFTLLLVGALHNSKSRTSCGFAHRHHHFLSVGGILCFIHGLISVIM